ncbi:MAG: tetratricopeptide repeat protein [Planctomycetes bacterium]|nr:tetratricopeptide repeat protein [Planctomycetota bacterium]
MRKNIRGTLALLAGAMLATTSGQAVETKGSSIFAPKPAAPTDSATKQSVAPKTEKPPVSSTARPTVRHSTSKLVGVLEVQADNGDLATAYDNYFRQHIVQPAVIREKIRVLLASSKKQPQRHGEIIAILEAALRNGQGQPWMYEALALSMDLGKRPRADVERALMSAADFSTNPDEMMYLARYMARLGIEARALKLFRQASALAPTRTEPYEHALELAQRLQDDEATQWAALGILRQAWPKEKAALQDRATYAVRAVQEKLQAAGKTKQAEAVAAAIAQALYRDAIVRVSWQGDADVDLMVEEPSGTVCSLRNRRTTSGGVMVGKSASSASRTGLAESSEAYVCPEGFTGNYKLFARIVWGKIPSGKVTLEVTTLNSAGQPQTVKQHIDLDDRGSLVNFTVANGRRKQSLELQQVATDVEQQLAVNRTVLAQQIAAISNPKAIAAQQIAAQAQVPFVTGFTPVLGRGGAVGFQPQITTLPSGATMSATAVISADRRYVRITALPFFSQVAGVSTFNVAQGTSADATLGQPNNVGGGVGGVGR